MNSYETARRDCIEAGRKNHSYPRWITETPRPVEPSLPQVPL